MLSLGSKMLLVLSKFITYDGVFCKINSKYSWLADEKNPIVNEITIGFYIE
jgi:hypothetical protein